MYFCGSRAEVIRDGESPAPRGWNGSSVERRKQRLGITISDGDDRDLHNAWRIFNRQAFGAWDGADTRSERIPGIERRVGHAAALNSLRRTHRSLGENIVLGIAVICRIGVDNAADRAVFIRQLRLQSSPSAAITG